MIYCLSKRSSNIHTYKNTNGVVLIEMIFVLCSAGNIGFIETVAQDV